MLWFVNAGKFFIGTYLFSRIVRLFGADWATSVLCRSEHAFDELALTHIGKWAILEPGVLLQGHTFEFGIMKLEPVVVGEGSYIGHDSLLLPGAVVGRYVTVDAGTLILMKEELIDNSRWSGSPARNVRN
eukprot:gene41879-55561_t